MQQAAFLGQPAIDETSMSLAASRAVVEICCGRSRRDVVARIVAAGLASESEAGVAYGEAAEAVRASAAFDRESEAGLAYRRLTDIYGRSFGEGDYRTAMSAQKEISRLVGLGLAVAERPEAAVVPQEGQLETAIRGYLVPLGLAPEGASLVEHIRLAAGRIIQGFSEAESA